MKKKQSVFKTAFRKKISAIWVRGQIPLKPLMRAVKPEPVELPMEQTSTDFYQRKRQRIEDDEPVAGAERNENNRPRPSHLPPIENPHGLFHPPWGLKRCQSIMTELDKATEFVTCAVPPQDRWLTEISDAGTCRRRAAFIATDAVVAASGILNYIDNAEKLKAEQQAAKESLEEKVARLEREVNRLRKECLVLSSEAPGDRAEILDKSLEKSNERVVKLSRKVRDLTEEKEVAVAQAKAEIRAAFEKEEAARFGELMKQKEAEIQEAELKGKLAGYKVGWLASSSATYDTFARSKLLRKEITKRARFSEPIYLANFKKVVLEKYRGLDFSNLKFAFTKEIDPGLIEQERQLLQLEREARHRAGDVSDAEEEEEEGPTVATDSIGYNTSLPREIADQLYLKFRHEYEEYEKVMECLLRIDQEAARSSAHAKETGPNSEKDKEKGKKRMGE